MKWSCPECGFAGSNGTGVPMEANEFPIHCICGFVESYEEAIDSDRPVDKPHWLNCIYRGEVVAEINAAKAGCGCSSAHANIYHCNHFGEPVMKRSDDRCRVAVATVAPGYTGRQCRRCDVFGQPTDLHLSAGQV